MTKRKGKVKVQRRVMMLLTEQQLQDLEKESPQAIAYKIRDTKISIEPDVTAANTKADSLGWIVSVDPKLIKSINSDRRNLSNLGKVIFDPDEEVEVQAADKTAITEMAQSYIDKTKRNPSLLYHMDRLDGTADGRVVVEVNPVEAELFVIVVDSGMNNVDSEFGSRIVHRILRSPESYDIKLNSHGTHVAGTITGRTVGIAPTAKIVDVKVFEQNGQGDLSNMLLGLADVVKYFKSLGGRKRGVLNMSLTSTGAARQSLIELEQALNDVGIVPVVAAGNQNSDAANFSPANTQCVKKKRTNPVSAHLTVGGLDPDNSRLSVSNTGICVDVYAMGKVYSILGLDSRGKPLYDFKEGTSMATPIVSGTILKIWAKNPNFTPRQIVEHTLKYYTRTIQTAIDLDCAGIVNGKKTLALEADPIYDLKIALSSDVTHSGPPQLSSKLLNTADPGDYTGFTFNLKSNKKSSGLKIYLSNTEIPSGIPFTKIQEDLKIIAPICKDPFVVLSSGVLPLNNGFNWVKYNVKMVEDQLHHYLTVGSGDEIGRNVVKTYDVTNEVLVFFGASVKKYPFTFMSLALDPLAKPDHTIELSDFKGYGKANEAGVIREGKPPTTKPTSNKRKNKNNRKLEAITDDSQKKEFVGIQENISDTLPDPFLKNNLTLPSNNSIHNAGIDNQILGATGLILTAAGAFLARKLRATKSENKKNVQPPPSP